MILAIDIDGVICTEEKQFSRPLAQPLPGAREAIARLRHAGHKVILYTARTWAEQEVTRHWLAIHGIEYDGLQMGKMIVDRFVDDRGIQFTTWDEVLAELESPKGVPGGWRAEHQLRILRIETKCLIEELARSSEVQDPVLEVGPMWSGSAIFKRMPETYVDARALFAANGKTYASLDIDPITGADHVGSLLDGSKATGGARFKTLLLISAIEHIPQIWRMPDAVHDLLDVGGTAHFLTPWAVRLHGPAPDCWRLSDEAYRALFDDASRFEIVRLEKKGSPKDSLDPVAFYCAVRRRG